MAITLKRDLHGSRNAPLAWEWANIRDDAGELIDFTAATLVRMQARLYGAAPGDPLIDLVEVGAALTEGLVPGVGSITGHIDEATLRLLPAKAAGETVRFGFDVLIQLPGVVEEVWIEGSIWVAWGVTDRLGIRVTEDGAIRITESGAVRVTE